MIVDVTVSTLVHWTASTLCLGNLSTRLPLYVLGVAVREDREAVDLVLICPAPPWGVVGAVELCTNGFPKRGPPPILVKSPDQEVAQGSNMAKGEK